MSDSTQSPVFPTRQQLDDLDALMERMLALPVSQPEEETERATVPKVVPVSQAGPRTVPEAPPWFDNEPAAVAVLPPPDRLEKMEAAPRPVEAPRDHPRPAPAPARAAWPLRPLIWCNRAFDRWTFSLGRTGRWLRHPVGRNFLGGFGLLCLAGAAAWAILDWIGWTW